MKKSTVLTSGPGKTLSTKDFLAISHVRLGNKGRSKHKTIEPTYLLPHDTKDAPNTEATQQTFEIRREHLTGQARKTGSNQVFSQSSFEKAGN